MIDRECGICGMDIRNDERFALITIGTMFDGEVDDPDKDTKVCKGCMARHFPDAILRKGWL